MTRTCTSNRLTSHWQRGCDDAKVGRGPQRPHPDDQLTWKAGRDVYAERLANDGYMKGYKFGLTRRHQPTHDEGSEL